MCSSRGGRVDASFSDAADERRVRFFEVVFVAGFDVLIVAVVFVGDCVVVVIDDDAAVVVVTGAGAGIEEAFVVVDEDFVVEAPVVVAFFAFAVDADVVVCDVVV